MPDETRTLVSALVEIARKQLTGISEVAVDGGKVRVIWSGGIPIAGEELGISRTEPLRDPREKNRLAVLACLRWQPVGDLLTFRESADSLRGVPQNPVALGPLIVASARRGFGPSDAQSFVLAREKSCPLLAIDAAELSKRLELRPNEGKLLELLDGSSLLRMVLGRCELDELHSVQLLAVLNVLDLLRWGPPRAPTRSELPAAFVVPRHTPVSPVRVTPVTASRTPSTPGETRISITPPTPSTPSPPPMSSPAPVSRSTMTPVARPTTTPSAPPSTTPSSRLTPTARPTFTPSTRPLGSSPISAPPGSGPPLSGRTTPHSLPPGTASSPPLSSAEARVEAAELYKQGKVSLQLGQTKQAQELFARAAKLAPEMYEYLLQETLLEYLSAKAQADRERLTKRLEGLVVRALTKDRKLAIAHRVRGYLALASGQDDPALKAFKMAKDLDPEDVDSQRHYLVLMRRKKR